MKQFLAHTAVNPSDESWIQAMERKYNPTPTPPVKSSTFTALATLASLAMLWAIYSQIRILNLRLELLQNNGLTQQLHLQPSDSASPRGPNIQRRAVATPPPTTPSEH